MEITHVFLIPSISDLDEVCANVVKLTKEIFDCKQQANKEVSNSIEKMGACLLGKLFLHITKDTAGYEFCAQPNNVINKIFECEMSSNNINEFNDCIVKSVIKLFGELNKDHSDDEHEYNDKIMPIDDEDNDYDENGSGDYSYST